LALESVRVRQHRLSKAKAAFSEEEKVSAWNASLPSPSCTATLEYTRATADSCLVVHAFPSVQSYQRRQAAIIPWHVKGSRCVCGQACSFVMSPAQTRRRDQDTTRSWRQHADLFLARRALLMA
jgi:hypothetical protein